MARKIRDVLVNIKGEQSRVPIYFDQGKGTFSFRIGHGYQKNGEYERMSDCIDDVHNAVAAINKHSFNKALQISRHYKSNFEVAPTLVMAAKNPARKADRFEPKVRVFTRKAIVEDGKMTPMHGAPTNISHHFDFNGCFAFSPEAMEVAERLVTVSKLMQEAGDRFAQLVDEKLRPPTRKRKKSGALPKSQPSSRLAKLDPDALMRQVIKEITAKNAKPRDEEDY